MLGHSSWWLIVVTVLLADSAKYQQLLRVYVSAPTGYRLLRSNRWFSLPKPHNETLIQNLENPSLGPVTFFYTAQEGHFKHVFMALVLFPGMICSWFLTFFERDMIISSYSCNGYLREKRMKYDVHTYITIPQYRFNKTKERKEEKKKQVNDDLVSGS